MGQLRLSVRQYSGSRRYPKAVGAVLGLRTAMRQVLLRQCLLLGDLPMAIERPAHLAKADRVRASDTGRVRRCPDEVKAGGRGPIREPRIGAVSAIVIEGYLRSVGIVQFEQRVEFAGQHVNGDRLAGIQIDEEFVAVKPVRHAIGAAQSSGGAGSPERIPIGAARRRVKSDFRKAEREGPSHPGRGADKDVRITYRQ